MGYSIFTETMVEMAWPAIEEAAKEGAVVLLPLGTIEEHGPHMGLGVDIYCAYLTCKKIRLELESQGIKTVIAPPYYWGISDCTGAFPGSFTVRKETMKAVLRDIFTSLTSWGFNKIFCINWHGDFSHNVAIIEATREASIENGTNTYFIVKERDAKRLNISGEEPYILIQKTPPSSTPPAKYLEIHAEDFETSIMAHYFPDDINLTLAQTLKSTNLTLDDLKVWRQGWETAKQITPLGYFGNPAGFNAEAGRQAIEEMSQSLASLIETFLKDGYKPIQIK